MNLVAPSRNHIVILIHGIRDFALWQITVRSSLERAGLNVEATNYGRLNLLEFLLPIPYFRRRAIETVWRQIRIIKDNNPGSKLSVVAHSFGTYVVSYIMKENFDIKFDKVIFCGSVVDYDFPFEQFQDRFMKPLMNEVGTRDIWPAVAESVTSGFGSAGTYGFRRPLVRDRWHNRAHHGYFLTRAFCEKFWIPFLMDGEILEGEVAPDEPNLWLRLLSIFKIKYLLIFLVILIASVVAVEKFPVLLERYYAYGNNVPDPTNVGTVADLRAELRKIELRKGLMSRDEIRRISMELTSVLITTGGAIARVNRRYMN